MLNVKKADSGRILFNGYYLDIYSGLLVLRFNRDSSYSKEVYRTLFKVYLIMEKISLSESAETEYPIFFKALFAAIQMAPSADNSQPCHIDWTASKIVLRYDSKRVSGVTFPFDSQATLLAAGAVIENIAQYCEQAGVIIEIMYFPASASVGEIFAEIVIKNMDAVSEADLTQPLFARHTNRFAYKKKAIPADVIDEMARMVVGQAQIKFLNDSEMVDALGRQVKDASEIRFQTQEVHEWLEKSLRFTPEQANRGDGLDLATLDLPPGGGAFLRFISSWSRMQRLNRIGAYKLLASIDAAPIKKAPAIIAFTAPKTLIGAMEAGRLLCRAWIYLNAQGIACHPYYVISDQLERLKNNAIPEALVPLAEKMRKNSLQLLNVEEEETLMMLMRVGYPTRQAPRSKRLPLEQVFTDLSAG